MRKYYSFKTPVKNTIVIKKSEFITQLIPVKTEEEIEKALKSIKKEHYDATHNCYAYIIGTKLDEKYKCSDDGEPSKTAGAPILDSLQKNELTNVLCVVTRYFGGIKLGAGGLVRAYSESASEAIKQIIDKEEIIEKCIIAMRITYDLLNSINKTMAPYTLISKEFEEDIVLKYEVPLSKRDELLLQLINQTNGKIKFSE